MKSLFRQDEERKIFVTVFEKIESQQKGHEGTVGWCVGQTLKEICEADTDCARIVAEDLENPSMSIHECAKKNKANADRIHKEQKGNCVYVPPEEEERIIREFYGLPAAAAKPVLRPDEPAPEEPSPFGLGDDIDLFAL